MFVDSHCHLDFPELAADLPQLLAAMREHGVTHALTIGVDLPAWPNVVALARAHANLYATVGVHPDYTDTPEPTVAGLTALAATPKVVAIGETGLDYHYKHSTIEEQQRAFRAFVALALRVKKPLVIHTRDADADTADILRETGAQAVGGVIHCVTGTPALAAAAIDLGFYVSFSGILTFKAADELRAIAKDLPRDRVLVETDCPFLAPVPHRGKKNEPAFVALTAERLAELWGVSVTEVQAKTSENTARLFGLPAA